MTPACYAHLVNSLSALANGKLAVVMEVSLKLFLVAIYFANLCTELCHSERLRILLLIPC